MTTPDIGTARRLQRLERVLAARKARLEASLARQHARAVRPAAPLTGLQRYGYVAAVLLALLAVAPKVGGFAVRRRRLLFGAVANGLAMRKLRKRFYAADRSIR